MSHFFTFFTNENGLVTDANLNDEVIKALSPNFNFDSIYIYSHGWWNNSNDAANSYNRFSIGYASQLRAGKMAAGSLLGNIPAASLCTGIHWPSTVSENPGMLAQLLEPASFFAMETRADDVGDTGVNGLLQAIVAQWQQQARVGTLTINFLGHSFGCKVVCSALQALTQTCVGNPTLANNLAINAVLLEAAFDDDDFEPNELYGNIPNGALNPRVLISKSTLDSALGNAFPAAHLLEFFKKTSRRAMGYYGPSTGSAAAFGGTGPDVTVAPGSRFDGAAPFPGRLVVADLTPLHAANPANSTIGSGHHSDIYYDEIYSLIARFLY